MKRLRRSRSLILWLLRGILIATPYKFMYISYVIRPYSHSRSYCEKRAACFMSTRSGPGATSSCPDESSVGQLGIYSISNGTSSELMPDFSYPVCTSVGPSRNTFKHRPTQRFAGSLVTREISRMSTHPESRAAVHLAHRLGRAMWASPASGSPQDLTPRGT